MKKLFEIYKETMLSPRGVLDKAIGSTIPSRDTTTWVKSHFSAIIDKIGKKAYDIFLTEQEKAGKRAIELFFYRLCPKRDFL